MIDSGRLASFVAFAEASSFTRAARGLHLSQPALFAQVAKLTDELGVALYRRVGRGVELTDAGKALLTYGRDRAERDRAFASTLASGGAVGPLVLAAGEGAFRHMLGPAVRAFAGRDASRIKLLTRDAAATVEAVRSGEAHVGVAPVAEPPDGLDATKLADVGAVVALPRHDPLARKRTLAIRDLDARALVVPPQDRPLRTALAAACAAAGVTWTAAVEATGWDVLLHFASLGLGLAVVNEYCRMPAGLVARPLRGMPVLSFHVLTRRGVADARLAAMRTALREHRWRFASRVIP